MKINKMRIMLLMIMMTMTMIMAMTMILVAIFFYDNDNNIVTRNCFLSKQHEASFLSRVNSQPSQALVTNMEYKCTFSVGVELQATVDETLYEK